ncbi:uncharacterized protein LOC133779418 [Humulus lupulus]|uniref:uncharacterized protein LOC133779418 n=1 Tax=Humulus lupulus TaxID=3486 RepID=UPI002B4031E5|nr:uncharacterized protein LOC133779418 [Humulus lupulus]
MASNTASASSPSTHIEAQVDPSVGAPAPVVASLIAPQIVAHVGYVLDTIPPPPATLASNIPNPEYLLWICFDQFLMHWMMNSDSDLMPGYVINCQISAKIKSVFTQLFATKSKARLLHIRALVQSTKKGSSSINEYILKIKHYVDALAAAGRPISDDVLILYILGGLGAEYESVVVNLSSRTESLTLQEVQFMLQIQEMRID